MSGLTAECIIDCKMLLGECPRWHPVEKLLYWVDIDGCAVHRAAADGSAHEVAKMPARVGCFAFCQGSGLLLAMETGYYAWAGFGSGYEPHKFSSIDTEGLSGEVRFNDGSTDPAGRLVAGTMDLTKGLGDGALYSYDPATNQAAILRKGFYTFNGLAFSTVKPQAYYADSGKSSVYRADYDAASGVLGEPSTVHEFAEDEGKPDGGCFDSEGYYWIALYNGGKVVRLDQDGSIVESISVPASFTTMCSFGGPDLTDLYVTTAHRDDDQERKRNPQAGGIFRITGLPVPGVPVTLLAKLNCEPAQES